MRVNIYASDQAKFFELREFTQKFTQPTKHLFFKVCVIVLYWKVSLSNCCLTPLSNITNEFLKGYKTALNTENPPYYAPFKFIKLLTPFLREAINYKVDFHVQL